MRVDTNAIAMLIVAVFIFLSGLHVYWAIGGLPASSAAVPQRTAACRPAALQCRSAPWWIDPGARFA